MKNYIKIGAFAFILSASLMGDLNVSSQAIPGHPALPPNAPPSTTSSNQDRPSANFGGISINIDLGQVAKMLSREEIIPDMVANEAIFITSGNAEDAIRIANIANVTIIEAATLETVAKTAVTVKIGADDTTQNAIARLSQIAGVLWAQPNHIYQSYGVAKQTPRRFPLQFALHGFNGAVRTSGTIALIDTLVDTNHAALRGANISVTNFTTTRRAGTHGTAIAALLVGTNEIQGVAQGARILNLAAFEENRNGRGFAQTRNLAKALNAANLARPDVINLSFGGSEDRLLHELIDNAMRARGICVVAAAGNNGPNAAAPFPASFRPVLGVTAIDGSKNIYQNATHGPHVGFSALGVNILSAVPRGYAQVSGTSFAAAIVSGGMLQDKACNRDHDPVSAYYSASTSAKDIGPIGPDATFGFGLFWIGN